MAAVAGAAAAVLGAPGAPGGPRGRLADGRLHLSGGTRANLRQLSLPR